MLEMVVVIVCSGMIAVGQLPSGAQQTGADQTMLCWSFMSLPGSLAVQGHCHVPPPCTLTPFRSSLVFSLRCIFLGIFLREPLEAEPSLQALPLGEPLS